MAISYEPLWATLEKLNLNMTDMRKKTGIATATMAKLRKNESLTLSMVDKICNGLHCNIEDVVKITQDSHSSTSVLEGLEVSALVRVESDDTKYNSGVIVSIISPGRGIPTYYVLVPIFNSNNKLVRNDKTNKFLKLSPMEMNGTVFTPSAKYLDEFSVTAKQITDIGGYISDEDMEKIRAYRDHENQKILENDYYGDE